MLLALGHHLNAVDVKDGRLKAIRSQHIEGDEVADLQLVSYVEGVLVHDPLIGIMQIYERRSIATPLVMLQLGNNHRV